MARSSSSQAGSRERARRSGPAQGEQARALERSSMRRVGNRRSEQPRANEPRIVLPRLDKAIDREFDGREGREGRAAKNEPVSKRVSMTPGNARVRNRRVVRSTPAVPVGPTLSARMVQGSRVAFMTVLRASYQAVLGLGTWVYARIERDAPEEAPDPEVVRSPWLQRSLNLLVVLALIAGGYGVSRFVQHHLTTAPAFAIDAVEIKGLAKLTREELLQAGGIAIGMNVFAQRPEDIHAKLLRHPWILSADVQRELPSRIRIQVREREPAALLVIEACAHQALPTDEDPACEEQSSLYLVSADARMIKRTSVKERADLSVTDLPVITGVTRERLAKEPELSQRVVTQAVALMQEYRNADLQRPYPIGEIHLEDNDGFSLYVGDDLTYVRLGHPPYAQKLAKMKQVFARLAEEHARAEYVYLDNEQRPDRVAVRLR